MSEPKVFGVYTAQFPFLDLQESKIRPVIVLSRPHGQHKIVAIIPISSKTTYEKVDVTLAKWSRSAYLSPLLLAFIG